MWHIFELCLLKFAIFCNNLFILWSNKGFLSVARRIYALWKGRKTNTFFVSKAEAGRRTLAKSFFVIISLNALIVYFYEYRFFFENLCIESSMFFLMLSLLISVFTLSLLPIHSRPIKFRNVILYASALILTSFCYRCLLSFNLTSAWQTLAVFHAESVFDNVFCR